MINFDSRYCQNESSERGLSSKGRLRARVNAKATREELLKWRGMVLFEGETCGDYCANHDNKTKC